MADHQDDTLWTEGGRIINPQVLLQDPNFARLLGHARLDGKRDGAEEQRKKDEIERAHLWQLIAQKDAALSDAIKLIRTNIFKLNVKFAFKAAMMLAGLCAAKESK